MSLESYRGTLLLPEENNPYELKVSREKIIILNNGIVQLAEHLNDLRSISRDRLSDVGLKFEGEMLLFMNKPLHKGHDVILPYSANTHDHAFQPPAITGELLKEDNGTLTGWLPTTLRKGEWPAKKDPVRAKIMAQHKLREFAQNGIGAVLEYATSSVEAVEAVLDAAEEIGIQVKVGYVAMDQGIDFIQKGLQTTGKEAIYKTRYLLEKYGPEKIAVIDRFPIAVTSATRQELAKLARYFGALYETHMDESANEKQIHYEIYGTLSIVETLFQDGVFEPGSQVGLAHAIHTTQKEIDRVAEAIRNGCTVYIRACPQSNAALGSHFSNKKSGETHFIKFPLKKWEEADAIITLGTDQGAGRNWNMFDEMMSERERHPISDKPDHIRLLRIATLNGLASLGIAPMTMKITPGKKANFSVVTMAGGESFYEEGEHRNDIESLAARVIEGGRRTTSIKATYVDGRDISKI